MPRKRFETLAVHAGRHVDPATGALVAPIHLATTFERDTDGEYRRGFSYGRTDNPNRRSLERCLADLEGGSEAIAFSSGLAVPTAVLHSLLPGDHIVAPDDVYHGFRRVLDTVYRDRQIEVSFVDTTEAHNIRNALRPRTRLIWVETPSNPLLKITDLEQVAAIARQAGILTVCDGTFATPALQHPLEFGIDMVSHSTTKAIAGHSDVVGGVLITREKNAFFETAREMQQIGGAVPSPFDCWLTLRGIATLPLRVRAQSDSAQQVAEFLSTHPRVEQVYYPGLPGHPQHAVARRQMTRYGGVLSFTVKGSEEEAMQVVAATQVFLRATSLGGTHSTLEHRASVEGPDTQTPRTLLRLSIGLEHPLDLVEDLSNALQAGVR